MEVSQSGTFSRRRFLIRPGDIHGEKAVLTVPDEIHHLTHVLRFGIGKEVLLLDGKGGEYLSRIETITPRRVEFKILIRERRGESLRLCSGRVTSSLRMTLAMALVKRQAMDFIVEKAVEFGVTEIIPLKTDRVAVGAGPRARPDDSRYQRWQRIIQAAAKQSGQTILPTIGQVTGFDEFLDGICRGVRSYAPVFFLTPNPSGENFAKVLLERKDLEKKICLMIGPEGGWSPREEGKAIECGAIPVRLADNTLRCETAVVAALALLVNLNILKDL